MKRSVGKFAAGAVAVLVVLFVVFGAVEFVRHADTPLVDVYHCPEVFERRWGDFTANVTGKLAPFARDVKYRVNGGDWIDVGHSRSRIPAPKFTIEIDPADLRPGPNTLEFRGKRYGVWEDSNVCEFGYDSSAVQLPVVEDWSAPDLDAQDGYWETIEADDGELRARPVPGQEDYDRILVITGAFAGARRVETSLILRDHATDKPFGFGVLPLWGGRPDRDGMLPRRGWNFSLVWYYSHYGGIGQEFSYKETSALPDWVSNYRSLEIESGVRYHIIVEAGPVANADGGHSHYYQRMKWWPEGGEEPVEWMDFTDVEGSPLPPGEFCVALVAHRSLVEYGPVRVLPLDGR